MLEFDDARLMPALCGPHDRHLALIEDGLDVTLLPRGAALGVVGEAHARNAARRALEDLYERLRRDMEVSDDEVRAAIRLAAAEGGVAALGVADPSNQIRTPRRLITARTANQAAYVKALREHDLTFGVGPAGTGKTYLAAAYGVSLLAAGAVDRLILSRPALEAGERIGFLPGDMKEKVDPFLRPLYDALYDTLSGATTEKKIAAQEIEIAPLAFMRGRTLARSFVILDEAQNATPAQMKMFLTRLGEGARMAVTGDPTQVDLPKGQPSGLAEALGLLSGVEGVGRVDFTAADVVRHPLVQRIIDAYEKVARP